MILPEGFASSLCLIAREAGDRIMAVREGRDLDLERKDDGSPVTRADHASQAVILEGLRRLTPDIPIIAEEQKGSHLPHSHTTYWLVDPLDGTRDFITGHNDFSVNIGLVVDNVPYAGLIHVPARDDMMYGGPDAVFRILKGKKTPVTRQSAAAKTPPLPRLVISIRDAKKNPTEEWLAKGHIATCNIHASAYKIMLVAAGDADIFVRTGITSEWDTAAGDAILRAVGGRIFTPDGTPLAYNKPGLANGLMIAVRADFDPAKLSLYWDLINAAPA